MFVFQVLTRVGLLFLVISLGTGESWAKSYDEPLDARTAERVAKQLTAEALRAGAAGDNNKRERLLETALKKSPDYAPAHWASGHVKHAGEWQTLATVQETTAADPRQAEYQRRKTTLQGEVDAHEALAKWCTGQGLEDEARAHWIGVLQREPTHRIALANLDLQWRDGQLVNRNAPRLVENEDAEFQREAKRWSKKVARWARSRSATDPEHDAVLQEVRNISDEAAIPAFEQLAGTLARSGAKRERALQLCHAFVEALDLMPGPLASESLVRHTVFAEDEALRASAAEGLVGRPLEESVPLLLTGLQPLTESEFDVSVDQQGNVAYLHRVTTKGREENHELRRTRVGRQMVQDLNPQNARFLSATGQQALDQNVWLDQQMAIVGWVTEYQRQAKALEEQIARSNLSATTINDRILPALRLATGQELEGDPQAWWDFWNDYRGYENDREYRREYDFEEDRNVLYRRYPNLPPPPPPRRCECFVAGTPVMTKTGPKPIEQVESGDFVLSREPTTGELSFRVVLETTVREPSPMVKVRIGDETIVSTVGHPFWVEMRGWRMAKQLEVGDRLSALDSSIAVEQIEPTDDAVAYNLVVEGTATYLVGSQGLLVHDNTPAEARDRQLVMR